LKLKTNCIPQVSKITKLRRARKRSSTETRKTKNLWVWKKNIIFTRSRYYESIL